MRGESWRPWPKKSPELLAHYVNLEATRQALPPDVFAAAGSPGTPVTLHDLRAAGRIPEVVHVIYDAFARLGIAYDLEPVLLDDPGSHSQAIRPPGDVIGRQGTCLDLVLVFAAACMDAHLLPQVMLLRNPARGVLHALVVIDAVNTDGSWDRPRGWSTEAVQQGMLSGTAAAKLWKEPDGELWKRVADDRYLLIECTGFAATVSDGRSTPTLSFADARAAALNNLRQMDHIATLDLVRFLQGKGYVAYEPPDPRSGASVYDIVVRSYPDLADFTYDNEFRDLIAAETARFVGRAWLADELTSFRASAASGYFCIVGDAGLGKTAIAADIANRERASAFFFSASENRTQLESCLRHLAVDIISRFSLPYDHLPERAGKDWSFLKTVLEKAAGQAGRILLVIDGVDEAIEAAGANTLFMPGRLPAGVHVVLTSRVDPILQVSGGTKTYPVRIAADDARQRQDVELFLEQEAARPELAAALLAHGLDRRALVAQLRDASDGNFMYLRYALEDLTRNDGTPGAMELGALPAGLSGYYEQFWAAMKQAGNAENWKEWDGLYLPTIAALGAAMEPVTAGWIAAVIDRPAREIAERALSRWQRFLRHQKVTGRWWIVHKSFADFLVRRHSVEVDAAHRRIAGYYLQAWGGLAAGLPQLATATPGGDIETYGRRQLAAHLRYGGDHEGLQALVSDVRWYSMRLAEDPSGEGFQSDLLQALAAAERRTAGGIAAGEPAGGIVQEVSCALALGSINSLSNNLPGELLAELVYSGHWQPASALRAIRMNPERHERDRALDAVAWVLDEPEISDALNQARALGPSYGGALSPVLWRLCTLGQGERALAEALRLPNYQRAQVLGRISKRLPDAQRRDAIAVLSSELAAHAAIPSDAWATALARLMSHAPESMLPAPSEVPQRADGPVYQIVEAVALRWAELGHLDRALEYLAAMTPAERTLATAKLVRYMPDASAREPYVQSVLNRIDTLDDDSDRATAAAALAPALDSDQLHAIVHRVVDAVKPPASVGPVYQSLAPVLPLDTLDDAATLLCGLEGYFNLRALAQLALRAAELGEPEKAVALGRMSKLSILIEQALSGTLPALAKRGHYELAVSYTERAEEFARSSVLPPTLAGVSRHVPVGFLDRLRDRAGRIGEPTQRRAALLGIAPRYAELGQPEEALALARLIDDGRDQAHLHADIAVMRVRATGDYDRVFDAIDTRPPVDRWRALGALAAEMPAQFVGSLLARLTSETGRGDDSREGTSRDAVLAALLERHAQSGFQNEAWALAETELPMDRYRLLAAVAPHLPEPERTSRLDEVMRELLAVDDTTWGKESAVDTLVAVLGEVSLRRVESELLAWTHKSRAINAMILRYATLGLPADALKLGRAVRSSGDIWTRVAPHLDAQGVADALSFSDDFWYARDEAVGSLVARLVELGHTDAAMARIDALTSAEAKVAAVAAVAPVAPPEVLDRLTAEVAGRQESSPSSTARAMAALAARYAALGEHERALGMLGGVSWNGRATGDVLAGMASSLEGVLLDRAIDIALSAQSTSSPDTESRALAALLPMLARRSVDDARRAARLAAEAPVAQERTAALASVAATVSGLPAADVHAIWCDAMHVVVTRTRRDVFHDLAALLPLVERLGGAAALDGVAGAVDTVVQRWT